MSSVKDQGSATAVLPPPTSLTMLCVRQCGSCWSFSAAGLIESAWALQGHALLNVSEQQLVSCERNCDGCNGGWPYAALEWVAKNGIDSSSSYPYVSGKGQVPQCRQGQDTPVCVSNYSVVPRDEDSMAAWVAKHGPISVLVDAMTPLWCVCRALGGVDRGCRWPYKGGIMGGCCNKDVDHGTLAAAATTADWINNLQLCSLSALDKKQAKSIGSSRSQRTPATAACCCCLCCCFFACAAFSLEHYHVACTTTG